MGDLFVKTHEPSTVVGGTLILDLHEESYAPQNKTSRMELAITTAASIAYLLQMSGEQVGMITNGVDAAELARYEVEQKEGMSRGEVDAEVAEIEQSARISPLSVATTRSPIQARTIIENLARVLPGQS